MGILYEVTGYDRNSGRLEAAYEVPENLSVDVKAIAGVHPPDDGLGSYPLTPEQTAEIAGLLRTVIPERNDTDYFLEPYEEQPKAAAR